MPPEAVLGSRGDQRSDVWQLGVILHEVLFGARPTFHHEGDVAKMRWPAADRGVVRSRRSWRACAPTAWRRIRRRVRRPRWRWSGGWRRPRGRARAARCSGSGCAPAASRGGTGGWRRSRRRRCAWRSSVRARADRRAPALLPVGGRAARRRLGRATPRRGSGRRSIRRARPYAADTFWSVDRLVQDYLARWGGMYTEACEATHVRGEQSEEVLDLRMSCLRERLDGVKSLTQSAGARRRRRRRQRGRRGQRARRRWSAAPTSRLLRNVLPPPDDAGDPRAGRASCAPGSRDAKALHDAGVERLALVKLRALVADARRIRYAPVEAEALLLFGEVASLTGDNDAAYGAFKEVLLRGRGGALRRGQGRGAGVPGAGGRPARPLRGGGRLGRAGRRHPAADRRPRPDAGLAGDARRDQPAAAGALRRGAGARPPRAGVEAAFGGQPRRDRAQPQQPGGDPAGHGARAGGGDAVPPRGRRPDAGAGRRAPAGGDVHGERGGEPGPAGPPRRGARRLSPRAGDRRARLRPGEHEPGLPADGAGRQLPVGSPARAGGGAARAGAAHSRGARERPAAAGRHELRAGARAVGRRPGSRARRCGWPRAPARRTAKSRRSPRAPPKSIAGSTNEAAARPQASRRPGVVLQRSAPLALRGTTWPPPARPRIRPPWNTTSPRRMVVRGQARSSRPA